MKLAAMLSAACIGFGLLAVGSVASADTTYYYPDQENAAFSLVGPDDWELTPGEGSEADWAHLTGPTGATLSFRSTKASEDNAKALVIQWREFLDTTYDTLNLGEPVDLEDDAGWYIRGTGRNKATGEPISFSMSLIDLGQGSLAQIWFAVAPGDKKGENSAVAILNTLTAH